MPVLNEKFALNVPLAALLLPALLYQFTFTTIVCVCPFTVNGTWWVSFALTDTTVFIRTNTSTSPVVAPLDADTRTTKRTDGNVLLIFAYTRITAPVAE